MKPYLILASSPDPGGDLRNDYYYLEGLSGTPPLMGAYLQGCRKKNPSKKKERRVLKGGGPNRAVFVPALDSTFARKEA